MWRVPKDAMESILGSEYCEYIKDDLSLSEGGAEAEAGVPWILPLLAERDSKLSITLR